MDLNFNNTEVFINENHSNYSTDVWVMERTVLGDFNINFDKKGEVIKTIMNPTHINNNLKPMISIPMAFSKFLFSQMAEHNEKRGIKTKDQSLTEGKLIATEKHLEDMKKIAFKLLKVE